MRFAKAAPLESLKAKALALQEAQGFDPGNGSAQIEGGYIP